MAVIKCVSLFEGRHLYPEHVKSSVFDIREAGYDSLGIEEFDTIALSKLIKWKAEGISIIYMYLSGLTSACVSVLNAANKLGIAVKLFHYSCFTDTWLPQNTNFIDKTPFLTVSERKLWKKDCEIKHKFTKPERSLIITMMLLFQDLKMKYRDKLVDWDTLKKHILETQRGINLKYLDMMRPYIAPLPDELTERKETYNVRLLRQIIIDRKPAKFTAPTRQQPGKYTVQRSKLRPVYKGAPRSGIHRD